MDNRKPIRNQSPGTKGAKHRRRPGIPDRWLFGSAVRARAVGGVTKVTANVVDNATGADCYWYYYYSWTVRIISISRDNVHTLRFLPLT